MVRLAAIALALVASVAVVGCRDGGESTSSSPASVDSGYFVGEGGGVGAAVDLDARGADVRAVRRSLGPSRRVAVAAVVNRSGTASRVPGFRAVIEGGAMPRLAQVALPATGDEPRSSVPRRLPARGARTLYLAFPAAAPRGPVVAVEMSLSGVPVATLRPRSR